MSRRGAIIVTSLILGLIALLVGGFFLAFEKVEEEVYEPPAGEARTNRFLALERFLNRDGWEADTVLTHSEPSGYDTMTVITGPTQDYGPEQIVTWESWVEDGGHLVIGEPPVDVRRSGDMIEVFGFGEPPKPETEEDGDAFDALMKDPGAETEESEKAAEEEDAEAAAEAVEGEGENGTVEADAEPLPMWGDEAEVHPDAEQIRFRANCQSTVLDATLDGTDRVWLSTDHGCLLAVSREIGAGRVTVVTNPQMFSNTRIENFEHASLAHDIFWQSTGFGGRQATISLYGQRISWLGYLWGYLWPTAMTLLIILGFALLAGTRRFGPVLAPATVARRQRSEHVEAIGRFLWKHDSADVLLKASQEALLHRIGRGAVPYNLNREERAKWLADRTDIKVDQALRLLAEHAPPSAEHFAELIREIEELRRR